MGVVIWELVAGRFSFKELILKRGISRGLVFGRLIGGRDSSGERMRLVTCELVAGRFSLRQLILKKGISRGLVFGGLIHGRESSWELMGLVTSRLRTRQLPGSWARNS